MRLVGPDDVPHGAALSWYDFHSLSGGHMNAAGPMSSTSSVLSCCAREIWKQETTRVVSIRNFRILVLAIGVNMVLGVANEFGGSVNGARRVRYILILILGLRYQELSFPLC